MATTTAAADDQFSMYIKNIITVRDSLYTVALVYTSSIETSWLAGHPVGTETEGSWCFDLPIINPALSHVENSILPSSSLASLP